MTKREKKILNEIILANFRAVLVVVLLFCVFSLFSGCHLLGVATLEDIEPVAAHSVAVSAHLAAKDSSAAPLLSSARENYNDLAHKKAASVLPAVNGLTGGVFESVAPYLAPFAALALTYVEAKRRAEKKASGEKIHIAKSLPPDLAKELLV